MTYELIWSLKNGDLDQVKEHFDDNVSIFSQGVNPFRLMVPFPIFLPQDIDINSPIEGRPPIHYASDYGQKEIVEYLISRGANVNATEIWHHCTLGCYLGGSY